MSSTGIALRQVTFEQRSFWRNPASAFFSFLFPIIFLVVFATLFKGQKVQVGPVQTTYDDYYIPALVAFESALMPLEQNAGAAGSAYGRQLQSRQ